MKGALVLHDGHPLCQCKGSTSVSRHFHNIYRIRGSNDLTNILDGNKNNMKDYAIGVAFWPVLLALLIVIASFAFCSPCTRRARNKIPHRRELYGFCFFASLVCILCSLIGGNYLQEANDLLGGGVEGTTNVVKHVHPLIDGVVHNLDLLNDFFGVDDAVRNSEVDKLANDTLLEDYTCFRDFVEENAPVLEARCGKTCASVSSSLASVNKRLKAFGEMCEKMKSILSQFTKWCLPVLIGIAVLFTILSTFRALSHFSSRCEFPEKIAVLPLLTLTSIAILLMCVCNFVLATVTADYCSPSFTEILMFGGRSRYETAKKMIKTNDDLIEEVLSVFFRCTCSCPPMSSLFDGNQTIKIAPIKDAIVDSENAININLTESISFLLGEIKAHNCREGQLDHCLPMACYDSVERALNDIVPDMLELLSKVAQAVLVCEGLPSLAKKMFYDSVCEKVQFGSMAIGVTYTLALVFLVVTVASRTPSETGNEEGQGTGEDDGRAAVMDSTPVGVPGKVAAKADVELASVTRI